MIAAIIAIIAIVASVCLIGIGARLVANEVRNARDANSEREDMRAAMEDTFGPESWQ